ncbi:MAG: purine nucleoside permease [Opitutaceae bacterium]|nr:purine nucleoside permease [Opitutaceae bacterium]|tara:strand:+ start:1254 stop:2315 length:1062 start_codon:yes stop_codon:yes gene_type:complete
MKQISISATVLASLIIVGCTSTENSVGKDAKIPVKVVVVSMFENGKHTGDAPGEMQFWVERGNFDQKMDFPLGLHDLYYRNDGVLLTCTGGGVTNATTSIMALGMDDRFDFSKAYWLIAGIAGVDPDDAALGDALWAKWVVDGDLTYEIDAREIPEDWDYGFIALGAKEPDTLEDGWTVDTIAFQLNPDLVEWAYELTKDIDLGDDPEIAAFRKQFAGRPEANRPPKVQIGDTLGSSTYWHGNILNNWANNWMKLHTNGEAQFMSTNMEDNGTLTALHRMARAGLADTERILVLRTASNFSAPPPGEEAVWSTTADYPAESIPAKEAAYKVGNKVLEALLDNWAEYGISTPQP